MQNNFLLNEKYIVTNAYSTNTLSVVENPLRNPVCDPEIRLIVSENIFNLLFRIDEKVLLKQGFKVTPLYDLGSDLEPLFLNMGIIMPIFQFSGILPESKIMLNSVIYI